MLSVSGEIDLGLPISSACLGNATGVSSRCSRRERADLDIARKERV